MFTNKGEKKRKAFEDLESAKKQYEEVHERLTGQFDEHNIARDVAYHEVEQAEELLESIRHKPIFGDIGNLKKIKAGKKTYKSKEEIERAEKKKLIETNAVTIAAVGVSAAAVFSFKDYIFNLFGVNKKRKMSWLNPKSLAVLLIVIVFFVVFWICYIVSQRIKRDSIHTIIEETKKIYSQTQKEKDEGRRLDEMTVKLKGHSGLLSARLAVLRLYNEVEFKKIPKEHQLLLRDYKNAAETLIVYLNN